MVLVGQTEALFAALARITNALQKGTKVTLVPMVHVFVTLPVSIPGTVVWIMKLHVQVRFTVQYADDFHVASKRW